jgi:hypothetical protein
MVDVHVLWFEICRDLPKSVVKYANADRVKQNLRRKSSNHGEREPEMVMGSIFVHDHEPQGHWNQSNNDDQAIHNITIGLNVLLRSVHRVLAWCWESIFLVRCSDHAVDFGTQN